ncbi:uncharacterized protein LOC109801053 isoform X2 [Cajanus cajan]|uniref:uncharacterized protein LOC109801053 isoform X2 n=1 Tax=Cajanus cajan TaxID=3821 RepID=UPI0010FB110A|nr:uncharacterized protein LOC109801053 isoform X2 [Cajanus cajan]
MGLMLRGFTKEGLLKQPRDQGTGQGAAVPGKGIVMITETGIIRGEVVAEAMIGMNVKGTVGETKIIVVEAGAEVLVLITRVVGGDALTMSVIVEAGADQLIAAPLHNAVLVLEGVLPLRGALPLKGVFPLGKVHRVKVRQIIALVDILLPLAVSHHVVALMLHEALPLVIQMVMNKLWMFIHEKFWRCWTIAPVAVLLWLDLLVYVNGVIRVLEGFYDLSAV